MPSNIEAQKGSGRVNLKYRSDPKNDNFEWEVLHFLTSANLDITGGNSLFGGGQNGPDLHFRLTPALPFWASMLEGPKMAWNPRNPVILGSPPTTQDGQDEAQDSRESTKSRECVGRLKNQGNVPQGWGAGGT